jgi:hypothetical protein
VVIEASDTIKPEHEDEQLRKYTRLGARQAQAGTIQEWLSPLYAQQRDEITSREKLATYLLTVPIEYRAGVQTRINELIGILTIDSAIGMTKSELDCQLRAPVFEVSDEEVEQQRKDLEHLLRQAVLAANDAASIQVVTMADYTRNIVRAAIATLLANKMIAITPHGDWLKVGYPKHLM